MVKKYLDKLINENNEELLSLEKELNRLLQIFEVNKQQIEIMEHEKSMDINIFSPRNIDPEAKTRLEQTQKNNESLNQEIQYVKGMIETHLQKKQEYEALIEQAELNNRETTVDSDIDNLSDDPNIIKSDDYKEDILNFFSNMYRKVELCLALINSDKNKCKSELKNMEHMIREYADKLHNL